MEKYHPIKDEEQHAMYRCQRKRVKESVANGNANKCKEFSEKIPRRNQNYSTKFENQGKAVDDRKTY